MGGNLHVICIVFVKCQNCLKCSPLPRPPSTFSQDAGNAPLPPSGTPLGQGPLSSGAAGAAAQRTMTSDTPSVKGAIIPATTMWQLSVTSRSRCDKDGAQTGARGGG